MTVALAGVVGFSTVGLYLVAWHLFVTQSSCRGFEHDDCTGAPLAMTMVGIPLLYVVWAVGLWATGARFAGLAPLAFGLALFVTARIVVPYETSLWLWPSITGVLSAVWRWRFGPEPSAPAGRRA
jgi:hypothetical protein